MAEVAYTTAQRGVVSLINVMKLMTILSRFRDHLFNSYALDPRSLAVFRIAVGLVVLVDLIRRFQHSLALYSDAGMLPRADAIPSLGQYRWSLLFSSGSPEFTSAIFLIGMVSAVAMILGWKTRFATILLWVILFSIQTRNHHLSSGADTLIRVSMFWAMFLPLGKMWSLDRYLAPRQKQPSDSNSNVGTFASVATFALILQTASVYLFTAIMKDGPRWTEEGTALYYALGARDLSTGLGEWVFQNVPESILTSLTYGTLLLEFAVPILILLPLRSGWVRTVGVLLIVSLQLGILATMTVGLFPAISIASAIGILPKWFWENVVARVPFRFYGSRLQAKFPNVSTTLGGLMPQPRSERVLAHDSPRAGESALASDGQRMHFVNAPHVDRSRISTILGNSLAALSIVLMMAWNVQSVSSYESPQPIRNAAIATGLYQTWSMFAPGPQMSSIWFVAEGELESGEVVDLMIPMFEDDVSLRNPVVWDQSEDMVMKDKYWRKYFHAIRGRDTESLRFAAYSCRTWNAENAGEDRLKHVTLTRAYARTLPDRERAEPVYDQLGSWTCF